MADESRSNTIQENPIGKGLDAFRTSFDSVCKSAGVASSPGALEQLSREGMSVRAIILKLI